MKGRQTHFFATTRDLIKICQNCECQREIRYVLFGLFEVPNPPEYESLLEWDGLGINQSGNKTAVERFIVLDRRTEIRSEIVPQRSGAAKYSISQSGNPSSIVFCPSGSYDEKTIIAGSLGTISDDQASVEIYNLFRRVIMKNSEKIGNYYVAENALESMKRGARMVTIGLKTPSEYDLKLP